MFWIYLLLQSFLYFLTLPLKLILTIITYFMWNPPFRIYEASFKEGELKKNFKINLLHHGDNGKFESIYAVIKKDKNRIFKFIDMDYNFTRLYSKKNWSGDMMSGWLYAFVYFYKNNMLETNDLIKFKKAVDNAFFSKPYFQFGKGGNRGYLFRWWFIGSDFIVPLATLWVYNQIFNNWKTKFLYYYFLIISLPLLFIYPNPSIATKRFYWVSWYSIHSKSLLAMAMLMMKGNFIAKRILKFSYKRYGRINPEITALYCSYFGWKDKDKEFVELFLKDYTDKKTIYNIDLMKEFISVKDLFKGKIRKIKVATEILPSQFRKNQYNWEKSLVHPYYQTESYLAYYHLLFLYEGGLNAIIG